MDTGDAQRQAFKSALEAAVSQRKELDGLIEALARQLGVEVPDAEPGTATASSATPPPANVDPASLVADGEFFGMNTTTATKTLMLKLGRTRPLKTTEIVEAITKGGVKFRNQQVLYKSLDRSTEFLRVAKGTWGLSEWYPDRVQKTARADQKNGPNGGDGDEQFGPLNLDLEPNDEGENAEEG